MSPAVGTGLDDLVDLLDLEPLEVNLFRGVSPQNAHLRIFGGQVLAQALMAAAPGQLIWGSDFPHLSFHDKVGTILLYNKLAEWAPDPAMRRRILADNPARLFGFS